ncbi:MAG: alpha/beta hydrolase family protein [Mariniblastus sp.]
MENKYHIVVLYLTLVFLFQRPSSCPAQELTNESSQQGKIIKPETVGFTARSIETSNGVVHYYLSTGGSPLDESTVRPLVIYLDGSGPTPIFFGAGNRIGTSLMFGPKEFPNFHYVAISKPGVRFHENENRISSKEYDQKLTLRWRIDAVNAVINELATSKFVDAGRILLVGHSEGADIVPFVASENKHVTHAAGLAPGGVSQMFDFIIFTRKKVSAGELTQSECDQRILEIKKAYRDIFADPTNTEKKWMGETYQRWATFFQPSMEAWCKIKVPVFLGLCRDDKSTPVESGEAIELEFIRRGKTNLTSRTWATNHHFQEQPKDRDSQPTDRRLDVLAEILDWSK